MENSITNDRLVEQIKQLCDLYSTVNAALFLAENLDPGQNFFASPLNEYRAALHHIFSALSSIEDQETILLEIRKTKSHLLRAGYDSLELVASNLCINIENRIANFTIPALNSIYPDYFYKTIPLLDDCKNFIVEMRTQKSNKSIIADEHFNKILDLVEKLDCSLKEINLVTDPLATYTKIDNIVRDIRECAKKYSQPAIQAIIPDYYTTFAAIQIKKERCSKPIKDIGNIEQTKRDLEGLMTDIDTLNNLLIVNGNALLMYDADSKKEKIKQFIINMVIAAFFFLLGLILS